MQADELLERDRCILVMHLQGRSKSQIAQDIGASRMTVWRVFQRWEMAPAHPKAVSARAAQWLRVDAPPDVRALLERPGAVVDATGVPVALAELQQGAGSAELPSTPPVAELQPEEGEVSAPALRVLDGGKTPAVAEPIVTPYKAKGVKTGAKIGANRAEQHRADLVEARATWDALELSPLFGADVTPADTRFGLAQRFAVLGDQLTQQVLAGRLAAARDAIKAYDSLRALLGADRKADDLDDQRELVVSLLDEDGREVADDEEEQDETW